MIKCVPTTLVRKSRTKTKRLVLLDAGPQRVEQLEWLLLASKIHDRKPAIEGITESVFQQQRSHRVPVSL